MKISWVSGRSVRFVLGLLTLAPIPILFLLLLFAPPDGNERAQLLQFIGRFHFLSIHLPIALLTLVPLLELLGRNRRVTFPYLLPAADFLLGVATASAIAAACLGWCLARGGGYSGPIIQQHMWGGVFVVALAWLCWTLRANETSASMTKLYVAALAVTVGVVSFTGYRGGQISQGENHLTEFMPEPLASWLDVGSTQEAPANSPNGGPNTFYGARIQTVLAKQCVSCHGRSKHKSNLRLDSYEAVMRGGKHGVVVKGGDAKGSDLLRRVMLAQSDGDVMPPDGRRLLSASDAKVIEQWIAAGASGTLQKDAIKDAPASSAAVAEVTFEEFDPVAVAKRRAGVAPLVSQLQQRFPNILDYESRSSGDIVITASWMGTKFGDIELAALAPLRDYIVAADFSSTAITDKSAGAISAMKHLRALRLMHTKIGDTTVQGLVSLQQVETLNLFDTPVTPASLPVLARLPKLQRVYVGETKISGAESVPRDIRQKLIF